MVNKIQFIGYKVTASRYYIPNFLSFFMKKIKLTV